MDFEIVWTDPAFAELEAIAEFISRQNSESARRVIDEILQRVGLLKTVPYIGAAFPRGAKNGYREVVVGTYRIFYQVSDADRTVTILTVWHASRRDPRLP